MHPVRQVYREKTASRCIRDGRKESGVKRNTVKRNVLYTVNPAAMIEHSCCTVNIDNTGQKDGGMMDRHTLFLHEGAPGCERVLVTEKANHVLSE